MRATSTANPGRTKEGSTDGVNQHAMQNMLAAARAYKDEPLFADKARWLPQHYPGQLSALILPLKD
jgi:hypothetical protein